MLNVLGLSIADGRSAKRAQVAWFAVVAIAAAGCTSNEEVPTKAAPSLAGNSSPDAVGQGPDAQAETGSAGNRGGTVGFDLASLALSGTRLKVKAQKSADGAMLPVGSFFDSKLGQTCGAMPADDGKVRCLPTFVVIAGLFSDELCSSGVAVLPLGHSGGYATAAIGDPSGDCGLPYKYRVLKLGQAVGGDGLYRRMGATCAKLDANSQAAYSCYKKLAVENELPSDQLVELEEVTLP